MTIMQVPVLPDPATEPTIDAPRVAAILGVSVRGVYLAIERGEIPCIRVGRLVRVPTARFLAQCGLGPERAA
jgi:excisionase family DNA binding protein